MLSSQELEQLTSWLGSVRSVMEKESVKLARLRATQALLSAQRADVEAAKTQVAEQRRAAAAQNLRRKRMLQAQALAAEGQVRKSSTPSLGPATLPPRPKHETSPSCGRSSRSAPASPHS